MYDRTRNLRHASGCALSVYEPAGSDVFQRGIYDYVYAVLFYSVCSRIGWKKVIRSRKFAEGEKRSILIITTDAEAANVVKALRGDSYGTIIWQELRFLTRTRLAV